MIWERLRANLERVRGAMAEAARRSGRGAESVRLVAVTKKRPDAWARALVELGAADLGENYPQELWARGANLPDLPARWHLIGPLQRNKARRTFPLIHAIHSVDSPRLLQALDTLAGELPGPPPTVYLQVNASEEEAKHGWSVEGVLADAEAIAACRRVPIRGLMTMAALTATPEEARPTFRRLRELREMLRDRIGLPLEDLSMGMSNDFEVAIEEGATVVRVGSLLFEGMVP